MNYILKSLLWMILFLIFNSHSFASDTCKLGVNKFYSENCEYYAEVINYSNSSYDSIGQTNIFKVASNELMSTIYFATESKFIFLSNNGRNLLIYNDDKDKLYYFTDGKLQRSYTNLDIYDKISDSKQTLRYTNKDLFLLKPTKNSKLFPALRWIDSTYKDRIVFRYKPDADKDLVFADLNFLFSNQDTVYLINSKLDVMIFPLNSNNYSVKPYQEIKAYLKSIANFKAPEKDTFKFRELPFSYFPKLENGNELYKAFQDKFNFHFYNPEIYQTNEKYNNHDERIASYSVKIDGMLNHNGYFEVTSIEGDTIIAHKKIVEFIQSLSFEPLNLPDKIARWKCWESFLYRSNDMTKARLEWVTIDSLENIESERKKTADTIAGVYIPYDLNNCFSQLDILLNEDSRKTIDGLDSAKEMISFHFGLGMWLRNNWYLWGGSRLSIYFNNLGVFHPDDMSGIILESYFKYRHKLPIELEKQIQSIKKYIDENFEDMY